jgi:hypothetical protein
VREERKKDLKALGPTSRTIPAFQGGRPWSLLSDSPSLKINQRKTIGWVTISKGLSLISGEMFHACPAQLVRKEEARHSFKCCLISVL